MRVIDDVGGRSRLEALLLGARWHSDAGDRRKPLGYLWLVIIDEALAANRANWDERVPSHLRAYGVDSFVADPARLSAVVRDDLALMAPHLPGGSPEGLSLLHLQCHIGLDTLSWARLGAHVTGLDFSPASTAAARDIARRAGLSATFVDSDVDHAADACTGPFDVVYTGIGAIAWLPDLGSWARAIERLLRPGGLFYVRDVHPMLCALDSERTDGELVVSRPYFPTTEPERFEDGTTYADDSVRLTNATTFEWTHPLGEIVESLLSAGLTLTSLREHRSIPWCAMPGMTLTPEGFVLAQGADWVPLTFSLTATKGALTATKGAPRRA